MLSFLRRNYLVAAALGSVACVLALIWMPVPQTAIAVLAPLPSAEDPSTRPVGLNSRGGVYSAQSHDGSAGTSYGIDGTATKEVPRKRFNSGPWMDPNDPSTWNDSGVGRLNIGEPMDPNDPSTWGGGSAQRIDSGMPADPNNPSTWPEPDPVLLDVGDYMNPNDEHTW